MGFVHWCRPIVASVHIISTLSDRCLIIYKDALLYLLNKKVYYVNSTIMLLFSNHNKIPYYITSTKHKARLRNDREENHLSS